MFENYVLADKKERIERQFNAHFTFKYTPQACISKGSIAPVIVQGERSKIFRFRYGMTPSKSKEDISILCGRAEGKHNTENITQRVFPKAIKNNGYFAYPLRYQRCVIPASALLLCGGVQFDYDWYLCHFINKNYRPFAIAGIYDTWVSPQTGQKVTGFCIITVAGARLCQKLGQRRAPLLLSTDQVVKWLSNATSLNEITRMMEPNFEEEDAMNAFPVDNRLIKVENPELEWLQPVGDKLFAERRHYKYKGDSAINGGWR